MIYCRQRISRKILDRIGIMIMKKFALASIIGLTSFSQLHSIEFLPEVKAAYFYPLDSRTRDIYSDGAVYGLELNMESCWCIYPWISGQYFCVDGRSIGEDDKTTLRLVPLGIGLKYMFCCESCWRPYVGLGFGATYLHTKDDSNFVKRTRSKWGYGLIVKGGSYFYFSDCWFFDIFIDYTWMKLSFSGSTDPFIIGKKADISNIAVGGGIGVNF